MSSDSERILAKLHAQSGHPSLEACILAVQQLLPSEIKALGAQTSTSTSTSTSTYSLTSEDRDKFRLAIIRAFSSDAIDQILEGAANGAYEAAHTLLTLLASLLLNCLCYDSQNGTNLVDGILEPILSRYVKTMVSTVSFARQVAQYGEGFDNEVIAFCANDSLSVNDRLTKIRGYIRDAEAFEREAQQIASVLTDVQDKVADLVASMISNATNSWPKPSTPVPNLKIVPVSNPPFEIGIALIDNLLSTPLRRLIVICGLLGVESKDAVDAAYSVTANGIMQTRAQKPTVLTMLHEVRSSDAGDDVNDKYFEEFHDNVAVLNGYWNSTVVDARHIESWLEDGASFADIPEYMELNLKEGVKTYVKVGVYLRSYADQIDSLHYDELLEASGYA